MADLKRLYVELATNVRPLVAGMAQGSTAVRKFGKDVTGLGVDLDKVAAKAAESSRRVVEAQLRVTAAQERLNTLRASGRASAQQQASAEAALIAAERNLARAHTQAADAAKAANGGLEAVAATGARTKNILSTVALVAGAGLAAGLLASTRAALDLEKSLYNVASISPEVAQDIGRFRDVLLQMSTQVPQSAKELAEGLYQIVSSGFQVNDALVILDASARAASAGLTTTEVAARAISATLKAYGMQASAAADVSDVMFKTVQDGVISFEELAQGIGDYIGTGAAAKVSVGELGAAIAAMTLSGVTAAESGTSLNRVLQSIIKPSQALDAAMQGLGYTSGAQALATDGLYTVMERLRGVTGGNVEELLKLFPEIRAARGAFALMANEGRNYADSFDDIATINGRVGSTQAALEQQQKSGAYQMTILKNQAVALGIELATTLLPAVKFVVGSLHDFFAMIDALPGPVTAVAAVLSALSAGALLGLGAFIRFRPQIVAFRESLATLRAEGSALPAALRGVSIAAAGVTAVLAIGTLWYGAYAAAKAKAKAVTDDFVTALQAEAKGQKDALQNQVIKDLTEKYGNDLKLLQAQGTDVGKMIQALVAGGDSFNRFVNGGGLLVDPTNPGSKRAVNDIVKLADSYDVAREQVALAGAAQKATTAAVTQAQGPLAGLGDAAASATDGTKELTDAQKGLRDSLTAMVDSSAAAKEALTALTDPSKVLAKAQQDAATAAKDAADKRRDSVDAQNQKELYAAQDRVKAVRNGTKAEKQAAADNLTQVKRANKDRTDALDKAGNDQKVTLSQWTAGLKTAAKEQATWEADLVTVARRAGVDVADALRGMGTDAVPLVHELATGTQSEVDQVKAAFASLAPSARQSLTAFTQELTKQVADQAAFVGNLVTLARRGHGAIVEELEKLPAEQAAPLAAQAAHASDKTLAPLEAALKRRATIAGDGTTEALAQAVEGGMQVVALAADQGAQAAADALVQKFGSVQQATVYLQALKTAINDLPTRRVIDIIVNQLNTVTTIGGIPVGTPAPKPGPKPSQGHSNDSDIVTGRTAPNPTAGTGLDLSVGHSYAEGGLRDAQIQPGRGRGLFQWAEGSTGGEAFIPLAPARRQRSSRILHTVARQFGMAVVPSAAVRSYAAGGSSLSLHSGGAGVVRLATQDVERVATALSRLLPRVQKTEFNGPIHGYDLDAVKRDAERQTRLNSLKGL